MLPETMVTLESGARTTVGHPCLGSGIHPSKEMSMRRDLAERLLVGVAAGVAASWAMSEFQNLWVKASNDRHSLIRPRTDEDLMGMIVGRAARAAGVVLKRRDQRRIGSLLHYASGAGLGAVYSVAAEESELITTGFGLGFASMFFAIADSLAPREYKPSVRPHNQRIVSEVYEWLAHVVYGITLEAARRATIFAVRQGEDALWDERFPA